MRTGDCGGPAMPFANLRISTKFPLAVVAASLLVAAVCLAPIDPTVARAGDIATITLAGVPDHSPRVTGQGPNINWKRPGWLIELFLLVEERVGVKFEYVRLPWKRCLHMVKAGDADAAFISSHSTERAT